MSKYISDLDKRTLLLQMVNLCGACGVSIGQRLVLTYYDVTVSIEMNGIHVHIGDEKFITTNGGYIRELIEGNFKCL